MTKLLARLFSPRSKSPRQYRCAGQRTRQECRVRVEELEPRQLLSAAGDWFSTYLPSPVVANLARNDWNNHRAINYNDMRQIYNAVEQNGPVNAAELTSLQFLAAHGNLVNTPSSVCFLESQIVNGSSLGRLYVGTSSGQMQGLVNQVFLGMNHPGAATGYSNANGNLFSSGRPSFLDVRQGGVGDCWLMASLAEVADRQPGVIQNMFTYDGTVVENGAVAGIYTVRLYHNGSPVYVTVDTELPAGGNYYAHPNGDVWVALAEKAYAEANAQGWVSTSHRNIDSYAALDSGDPAWALSAITGQTARDYTINPTNIASAWRQGELIVLCTSNPSSPYIVPSHCYAVVGYNASSSMPFEIYNPWGTNSSGWAPGGYHGHAVYGLFYANAGFVSHNFAWQSFAAAQPGGAGVTSQSLTVTNTVPAADASAATAMGTTGNAFRVESTSHSLTATRTDAFFAGYGSEEFTDLWRLQ
jgi:hypothetical protein